MDDQKIIELYFARNEDAIVHTAFFYGKTECSYVTPFISKNAKYH